MTNTPARAHQPQWTIGGFLPILHVPRATLLLLSILLLTPPLRAAQEPPAQAAPAAQSQPAAAAQPAVSPPAERKMTEYSLPPELYKKAHDRARIHFRLALIGFAYGLLVYWLVLHWKISVRFRDWAEKFSARRFLQSLVFSPLFLVTTAVFTLPLDIYDEWLEKGFGISVQSWGSWSWDWVKAQIIGLVIGTILIWLLYAVIRRSPRRWWFYFWLVALPIGIFIVLIAPWVIDPMFHKFEPLQQKDPALTASLEQLEQRLGVDIPPERMFWMGAGEKTTGLDAYVTGIGASKRIVVWDTTIAKMNTRQIVFVVGHETGHYVLEHVRKGIVFFGSLLLLFFYLGYRTIGWTLARWGPRWSLRGLDDWASLPALLLLLSLFSFVTNPVGSAFSRYLEHQADQFGLEATHGLTPDSGQVAAQAFQILGEVDLADPDPNPVAVFLFASHPPMPDRVRFALTYDPWSKGGQGEFVK